MAPSGIYPVRSDTAPTSTYLLGRHDYSVFPYLLIYLQDVHTEWVVQRSKSAGTEPHSTGPKQLTEDDEAGVGCQRALSCRDY